MNRLLFLVLLYVDYYQNASFTFNKISHWISKNYEENDIKFIEFSNS